MTPIIMHHPLIQHKISLLRDKNTGTKEFRELVSEIAMLMCYEATRDLRSKIEIETPVAVAKTKGYFRQQNRNRPYFALQGLGMVDGMLNLIPAAKVGHMALPPN